MVQPQGPEPPAEAPGGSSGALRKSALRFVLLVGAMSFFADFTYEGSRSILGPFLATLGASALAVGVVTGFGELLGYGLRFVSGRVSDRTQQFWPITIAGYFLQMAVVPLLAFAGSWQIAAVLIVLERVGKATRNPPRDVMLSHAAHQMSGYGWAFGLHEAFDQAGAMVGPLAMAAVLAERAGGYRFAFATLAIPAVVMLCLLVTARLLYPRPEEMESRAPEIGMRRLPRVFWMYLVGAMLVAAGFADFPLIAYHFAKASVVSSAAVPILYAVAMGVSGAGSLLFGRLFDRAGLAVLVPLTLGSALFAPFVFLGGYWLAVVGVALWGLGMGVHESIMPAAVAPMVSRQRRASAFGLFTAAYGGAWFLGSAAIGALYGVSLVAVVVFSVGAQLAALPLLVHVVRRLRSPV